jgi:acyl-CoA hydrolase
MAAVVTQAPVKFDGCAVWDPRHELLEAKGPRYAALLNTIFGARVLKPMDEQANRQYRAAAGRPIDWHVAEREAADKIRDRVTGRIDRVEFTPPIGQ